MTYIIGEIGQNHNGSIDIAKLIIELAIRPLKEEYFGLELANINAVKLTKRDLSEEMAHSKMIVPYGGPHSFGKTYGEHRTALELSNEAHFDIYQYAKSYHLDFIETICSIGAMSILNFFQPDFLKVASRDLTNLPLISALSETNIPIIISTGMAGKQELDEAIDLITRHHNNISILHCVSEYPTHPDHVNLNTISFLIENYSPYCIGYSDHTIGIATAIAAVAKGAKIIEKHITIDRDMKGSDQKCSLGPEGIKRMVRDIRLLERSLGEHNMSIEPATHPTRIKLERSIAVLRDLDKGHILKEDDLHLLSPGDGFKWSERSKILGKKLNRRVPKNELIYPEYIN